MEDRKRQWRPKAIELPDLHMQGLCGSLYCHWERRVVMTMGVDIVSAIC